MQELFFGSSEEQFNINHLRWNFLFVEMKSKGILFALAHVILKQTRLCSSIVKCVYCVI